MSICADTHEVCLNQRQTPCTLLSHITNKRLSQLLQHVTIAQLIVGLKCIATLKHDTILASLRLKTWNK